MVREPWLEAGRDKPNDRNAKVAEIIKLVTQVGPDIPEISGRLGIHRESVRYTVNALLKKGFVIQGIVNNESLGLRRILMKVKLEREYEPYGQTLFAAMNQLCYVIGYAKTVPEDYYMIQANVPQQYVQGFMELMEELEKMGILKLIEFYNFNRFRNIPMKPENYNFEQNRWDFDWSKPLPIGADDPVVPKKVRLDQVDLLILKELQVNASRSLDEQRLAVIKTDHIDVNYKTWGYHWNRHVLTGNLLLGYRIIWAGTFDPRTETPKQRQHKYFFVYLLVKDVTETEKMELMGMTNRLPFLWAEGCGQDYWAEFIFPVSEWTDAFLYLKRTMAPVAEKAKYQLIDQTNAIFFSLSYQLFDDAHNSWSFNKKELMARFENLVVQTKSGSG